MSEYADYDSIANNYDKSRAPTGAKIYIGLILEHFRGKNVENLKILDVGCGTGNYAEVFVKERIGKLSLVDGSEGMLNQAKNKLQKALDAGDIVEMKQGYLPEIQFEDGSFDVVMINQVLHHLSTENNFSIWESTISNAFKVLKPGGLMFLNASPGIQHAIHWYCHLFPNSQAASIARHANKEQILDMFNKAGFKDVQVILSLQENYWKNRSRYLNPEGPLDPTWRHADSFWEHTSTKYRDEFHEVLKRLEEMKSNGELTNEFVDKLDSIRRNNGSFTIFVGYS